MQEDAPLDKSPQRIRGMFDAIAPWYDFLNHLLSLGIDRSWRTRTAKLVVTETLPEGPLLDVCCGTGDLTLAFQKRAQTLGRARKLFGVDFSEKMVEIGKKKTEPLAELSVGDALNLPFEDDRFAAVAVAFGLRNVGNTEQGLAEMVRVCRPGGIVAVLEFSMPTLPVVSTLYRFYFRMILPRIGQIFSRSRDEAYRYLPESVLEFDTPHQLAEQMSRLGVTGIRTESMTFGISTLVYGVKEQPVP